PFAALALALHRDACECATGGLEPALFTLLAVAGYALLAGLGGAEERGPAKAPSEESALRPASRDVGRAALAATVLALAALTRPDGAIFALLGGAYVLVVARPRLWATLAFVAALAVVGAPYALWKLRYYGDLLPNTYYAKSAGLAWWDQGLTY